MDFLTILNVVICASLFGVGRSIKGLTLPLQILIEYQKLRLPIFFSIATALVVLSFSDVIINAWNVSALLSIAASSLLIALGLVLLFQPGYKANYDGYKWNPRKVAEDRAVVSVPVAVVVAIACKSLVPLLISPAAIVSFYVAYWLAEKIKRYGQLLVAELALGSVFFILCDSIARILGGGV